MVRATPMSLAAHFAALPDPRVRRTRRHALVDILVITVCAVICGADDWVAIARFGRAKRRWFRQSLALPHGIPSHDTFGRVFAASDPQAFHAAQLARIVRGHAPENLATLHHIALNLLKQERTEKLGIKNKRLAAGWDHDYLLRVIMAARD